MALFSSMRPCICSLWTKQHKVAGMLYRQSRNVIDSEYFLQTPTVYTLHTSLNALTGTGYPPPPEKFKAQYVLPEIHKKIQKTRKMDGLSEDWDLIYDDTRTSLHKYLLLPRVFPIAWAVVGLPYEVYKMPTLYYGDTYTVFAGYIISDFAEVALLCLGMCCLQFFTWHLAGQVPRRIYYNRQEDRYLGVWKSWMPLKTRQLVFTVDDIVKKNSMTLLTQYFPFLDNAYRIKNKPAILIPTLFFRGADWEYMVDRSGMRDW